MRLVEIAIAVGVGVVIWSLGLWAVRLLATPQPAEPDPDDVIEVSLAYRCTICGLRLVVTHASDDVFKAPRHCREGMELEE